MFNLKRFPIFFLCASFIFFNAFSVPAYPDRIKVKTTTGKDAYIYLKGDESCKYALTEDGYTLLQDSIGWKYAEKAPDGFATFTEYMLEALGEESEELKAFKQKCEKGIPVRKSKTDINSNFNAVKKTRSYRSQLIGEKHALVILIQFRDVKFKKSPSEFNDLFNEKNHNRNGACGSVRDFYDFASKGKLDYVSHIYGPYTASADMRYYGRNVNGGNDANALELAIEAIENLPTDIELSIFDNDKDGTVDNIHIVFAGYGEEAGGSANAIWSHAYPYVLPIVHSSGFTFERYSCTPELKGNSGNQISNIGVICHELGHTLGAMDFYDTDYEANGQYEGTGKWDIMANGSWNDNGRRPANFNPYVRAYNFGWSEVVDLSEGNLGERVIDESYISSNDVIYRISTKDNTSDYFLMENRQQIGFDMALPGSGLMIYHVHPKIEQLASTNTINASHPQALYPVCASFSQPKNRDYGEINSSGCPFPGISNNRFFTPQSNPTAISWNGTEAVVGINNIESDINGIVSFLIGSKNDTIVGKDTINNNAYIYKESFENGLDTGFSVLSITGREIWNCYPNNSFWASTEMIPKAVDGRKILTLFSGKNTQRACSEIISPTIEVEKGGMYNLTLQVQSRAVPMGRKPCMNIYKIEEESSTLIYTQNDTCTQWKTITIPITVNSEKIQYKIYGEISSGGLFVDDIIIYKDINTDINREEVGSIDESVSPIYNVTGMRVNSTRSNLPTGIYIQNGKKFVVM